MTENITGVDHSKQSGKRQPSSSIVDFIVVLSALPLVALFLFVIAIIRRLPSSHLLEGALSLITSEPEPGSSQSESREKHDYGGLNHHREQNDHPSAQMRSSLFLNNLMSRLLNGDRLNYALTLRNRHYLMLDLLAMFITPAVALTLRQEGLGWLPNALPAFMLYTVTALLVKVMVFYLFGLYGRYWPLASVSDASRIVIAAGQVTFVLAAAFIAAHPFLHAYGLAVPRTTALIDGMITVLVIGGIRFSLRGFYDWHRRYRNRPGGLHVLIVGAGEAGMMTAREIWSNPKLMLEPVAFVDDDPAKVGSFVYGLPVIGDSRDIPHVVDLLGIQRIIVAMPSVPLPRQLELVNICRETGVVTDTLPGVYQILAGHKAISPLPQVDINRLLRRKPVEVDTTGLAAVITGARIMVTGAGGSIGSELCRQISLYQPGELILLGHGENSIFELYLDLSLRFPNLTVRPVIADVRDRERINWAVRTHRPDIIFHAAAHKHVPLMEDSVSEAVMNNVLGTRCVLQAADRFDVQRFVLISSDKAINPVNVMGVTKRIAELLTLTTGQENGRRFMVVRFGNVLGSRGSVIPVFQRQIAAGGPVTITHRDMVRYFMTIPEAVQLVLQSTVLGKGGEIFVLDMGEPVRIVDMAMDLIKLCGLQPSVDIDIVYTGIRPGEKLKEELFLPSEEYCRSSHVKVFEAVNRTIINADALSRAVDHLILAAKAMQTETVIGLMAGIVPEYRPSIWSDERMVPPGSVPTKTIYSQAPLLSEGLT